jgi:fructokinase
MNFSVLGIGEVLWDLLPDGPQLGGAPANFACHARALGANASLITRIGEDELGRRILKRFEEIQMPLKTVQMDPLAPTGTASVTLNESGIPRFHFQQNVAWDRLALTPSLLEAVQNADAVCFGTLAQRDPVSRTTIQSLLAVAPTEAVRILDVNIRENFYSREIVERSLRLANVLKLNNDELKILAEMFSLDGAMRGQIAFLAEMFQLNVIALTFGERGSFIYAKGTWSEQVPAPAHIVDTVGAGDSFVAALVMGLLTKMPLEDLHSLANDVASFVCSQPGATPVLPEAFRKKCQIIPLAIPSQQTGIPVRQSTPGGREVPS